MLQRVLEVVHILFLQNDKNFVVGFGRLWTQLTQIQQLGELAGRKGDKERKNCLKIITWSVVH